MKKSLLVILLVSTLFFIKTDVNSKSRISIHSFSINERLIITKKVVKLKPIENLCPTTLVSGDLDFGGNGPKVFGVVSLELSENKKQIIAEIRFNARETVKDSLTGASEVKGYWKMPVYNAPEGSYIDNLEKPLKTSFEKILQGFGKNERSKDTIKYHKLKASDGIDGKGQVLLIEIVGDTKGIDISKDSNCKNHTRILKIVFKPIEIVLKKNN